MTEQSISETQSIPIETAYSDALGRALYSFARLEWQAVYCCEALSARYVYTVRDKTAGMIATDFIKLANQISDPALRADCARGAANFQQLVKLRNAIVHAKPGTTDDGLQLLFRDDRPLRHDQLNAAIEAFVACETYLNMHYYGQLQQLTRTSPD